MNNNNTVEQLGGVFEKESKTVVSQLAGLVDWQDHMLWYSAAFIVFNPVFWNIVARLEYRSHVLTKLTGSAYNGCYLLAVTIFSLGIGRDMVFNKTLHNQPTLDILLTQWWVRVLSMVSFSTGQLLVITSLYQLGITGTYLGDYFGILMNERVTGFPFNVSNNPMYVGSTLSFIGTSLYYGKPAGLFLSLVVYVMYCIALKFEEPFTAMIYSKKVQDEKRKLQ